jgi:hypothetical protein
VPRIRTNHKLSFKVATSYEAQRLGNLIHAMSLNLNGGDLIFFIDSEELKLINETFKTLMNKYRYHIVSFGELCPTLGSVGVSAKLVTIDSSGET